MEDPKNPVHQQISKDISSNNVMLFVKGNRDFPQCGFSKYVMGVFMELNVPFETRDVLADPSLRENIKVFSDWPTVPQIYIKGKFVGGCDIIRDLYESGEIQKLVKDIQEKK